MTDISMFLIGVGFAFVLGWIAYEIIAMCKLPKQIKIYPEIANNIVGETPYCPDCESTDLKLVDITDGVSWLKGHIGETDWYQCRKCGRMLSDEDWMVAKKY